MYLTLRDVIHPVLVRTPKCKQSSDIIGGVVNKLRVPHFGQGCCATCGAQFLDFTNKICPLSNWELKQVVIGLKFATYGLLHACLAETGNCDLGLRFAITEAKLSERRSHKTCDVMVEHQRRCYNEQASRSPTSSLNVHIRCDSHHGGVRLQASNYELLIAIS
jgi:hypothetical protein